MQTLRFTPNQSKVGRTNTASCGGSFLPGSGAGGVLLFSWPTGVLRFWGRTSVSCVPVQGFHFWKPASGIAGAVVGLILLIFLLLLPKQSLLRFMFFGT
jgi:hypothetical protein